jgi:hypothetical protein
MQRVGREISSPFMSQGAMSQGARHAVRYNHALFAVLLHDYIKIFAEMFVSLRKTPYLCSRISPLDEKS